MLREDVLVRTFVELADTLVDDFDISELLTRLTDRCVDLLDVSASGLMVAAPHEELRVVVSSSDAARVLELFELQANEGPCPECYETGKQVMSQRLDGPDPRWPHFGPRAVEAGFRSVHALPMRLRGQTIGALNLFRSEEGRLSEADVAAAQAFADVATIAILQHRAAMEAQTLNEQLNHALNSRVTIEQAKGMISECTGLDMELTFRRLRNHARNHNLKLVGVAGNIIDGTLAPTDLDPLSAGGGS